MPSLPIYESEDYQMVNTNVHLPRPEKAFGVSSLRGLRLWAVLHRRLPCRRARKQVPGWAIGMVLTGSTIIPRRRPTLLLIILTERRKRPDFRRQRLPSLYADGFRWQRDIPFTV